MKYWLYCTAGLLVCFGLGAEIATYLAQGGERYEVIAEQRSPDGSDRFQVLADKDNTKILINFVIDDKTVVRFDTPLFNKPSYHEPVVEVDWIGADRVKLRIDQDFGADVKTYQLEFPAIVEVDS
jgi:hypothetical protein